MMNTAILTHPEFSSERNGDVVSGSVYLERPYLNSGIANRIFKGLSQKEGGFIEKTGSLSASMDFKTVVSGGTNSTTWYTVRRLYDFYSLYSNDYTFSSSYTTLRIITIPQVYYNREILSGSLTASDTDGASVQRNLYDNGRGGVYSGSLTGSLVGNIFYQEGIIALTKTDLTSTFGVSDADNFKWRVQLKGTHSIPVKIFRCRAPQGQLNVSNNTSFYVDSTSGSYAGMREIVSASLVPYVSQIGIYNELFELVAVASLAQVIKREDVESTMFKLNLDW